jgi:hypothetical protein
MIVQYIFLWGMILFILFWAIIKIKYPFWNNQPVFHTYDYIRSLYKQPFIIQHGGPYKTKFVDELHIHTYPIDDEHMHILKDIAMLLQSHHLASDRIDYMIQSNELSAIHTGQREHSYMSVYQVLNYEIKQPLIKNENNPDIETSINSPNIDIDKTNKTVGCVTSRAVTMYVRPTKNEYVFTEFPIYFIDFLCVNREHDEKTVSRKLIQTHEYNQRNYNKNINCSLLKKSGELFGGIRPLITYTAYSYNIPKRKVARISTNYTVSLLQPNAMTKYLDFFTFNSHNEQKTLLFDVMVLPSIGNMIAQIREKCLYVGCICEKDVILGFYFFKDAHRYNEEYESKTLTLVASLQNCTNNQLFYMGFLHVLRDIIHTNADYKAIVIENIGHNQYINNVWGRENMASNATNMAYYSYNYVYPCSPIDAIRSFILH